MTVTALNKITAGPASLPRTAARCHCSPKPSASRHWHGRSHCKRLVLQRQLCVKSVGHPVADAIADRPSAVHAPSSTVIVGGGPAGLAAAIMLARRGWRNIEVWEKLSRPPPPHATEWGDASRSYNLGVTARGQIVLAKLGALDRILQYSVPLNGAMSWTPEQPGPVRTGRNDKSEYSTQILQRDRLAACLVQDIEEKYSDAVTLRFQTAATLVHMREGVALQRSSTARGDDGKPQLVNVDFVVGADGGNSPLRTAITQLAPNVKAVMLPENPKNTYVYKTVTLKLPDGPDWPLNLNYKARSPSKRVIESLPTKEGNQVGILLFKENDDEVLGVKTAEQAAAFFQREFPGLFPLIPQEEFELFAQKSVSRLPFFQYTGGDLHYEGKAVLLGDAIHIVKPYFGLGVNAAFEDVRILEEKLDAFQDDTTRALPAFTKTRAPDTRALVEMSHKLDQGFVHFILPMIVDRVFHRLAPWLFAPSIIGMMQDARARFSYTQRRKRLDRVLQGAVIAAVLAALFSAVRALASWALGAFRGMSFA